MNSRPDILLVDDGKLTTARRELQALGLEFAECDKDKFEETRFYPERLFVTTAATAAGLECRKEIDMNGANATWVAFLADGSKSQRSLLKQAGFDFLVTEPVHPAALRSLFARALYAGREQRRVPRVAFGYAVQFKARFWPQKATLADLSPRGARFLTSRPPREGARVTLAIPKEVSAGRALTLVGKVVRVCPAEPEGGAPGESSVGVRFDNLSAEHRSRLRKALVDRLAGPAILAGPARSAESGREQRSHPRARYTEEVTAFVDDAAVVLLGSDISAGGMRVDAHPGISVGEMLRLAVHGPGGSEPFLVEARAVRDDGAGGIALQFDWVEPEAENKLRELMETLPAIDPLGDDTPKLGRVLTRVLPASFLRN